MIFVLLALVAQAAAPAKPPPILLGPEPEKTETTSAKPTPATFDPAVPLTGSTPWTSFDEGYRCTVERTFGAKPGSVALKLARSSLPGGVDGNLLLVRRIIPYRYKRELTIDFNDGKRPLTTTPAVYVLPKVPTTMFRFGIDSHEFWSAWEKAATVTLRYGKDVIGTLSLAGSRQVAKAAGDCARRHMLGVGGTAAEAAAWLGETPSLMDQGWQLAQNGRQQNLFFSDDYPASARDKGIGGRTLIAYRVGVDGRPDGCRIVNSSRNRELDEASCAILVRRVVFTPARDPAGRNAAQIKTTWINWVIPSDADFAGTGFVSGFTGAGQGGGTVN